MKLNLESLKNRKSWRGYHLPDYDIEAMAEATQKAPQWLHFGAGNIFISFLCAASQRALELGVADRGIICAESFDSEIITERFRKNDNLSVAVTLCADGTIEKEVVASVAESLTTKEDLERIKDIFCSDSLEMVSFTITEKGYSLRDSQGQLTSAVKDDIRRGPEAAEEMSHLLSLVGALCLMRRETCGKPLALVSMDNCSRNGEKLREAVLEIASGWKAAGLINEESFSYLETEISYPWTMIDKITPRPDERVETLLAEDGLEGMRPFVTGRGTYAAAFVNAERPQYLVIEDDFPNGRPPLEKAGIIFTDRESVNKIEKMKVGVCLNPLHTALAIFGCLLGFSLISQEMKDPDLSALVSRMSREEGMPVVVNPEIIDPEDFLNEVLSERFPNPFMPDSPQRIATDTSQKLAARFGDAIKAHMSRGDSDKLVFMPLVLAGWLRYLLAVDDQGEAFELSPDPALPDCQAILEGIALGDIVSAERLKPLLSDVRIFGADLYEAGLAEKITGFFNELISGEGAVRRTLHKYVTGAAV